MPYTPGNSVAARGLAAFRLAASAAAGQSGTKPGQQAWAGLAAALGLAALRLASGFTSGLATLGLAAIARTAAAQPGTKPGQQAGAAAVGLAALRLAALRLATLHLGSRLATGGLATAAEQAGIGGRGANQNGNRSQGQYREKDTTVHGRGSLLGRTKWDTYTTQCNWEL